MWTLILFTLFGNPNSGVVTCAGASTRARAGFPERY